MLGSLGAAIYHPVRATSSRRGPWQVGVGASLGVLAGLLLTQSPLGLLVVGVAFLLPVHFAVTLATSLLAAGLLWTIEPALGEIGSISLTQRTTLQAMYWGYQFPGFALLRLNNTVVHGGLVRGLMQLFPTAFFVARLIRIARDHYDFVEHNDWLRADKAHEQVLKPRISFSKPERAAEDETELLLDSLNATLDAQADTSSETINEDQPDSAEQATETHLADSELPQEDTEKSVPYLAWSDFSDMNEATGYEQSRLGPIELNPTLSLSPLETTVTQLKIPGESLQLNSLPAEEDQTQNIEDEAELLRNEMASAVEEIEDAPPLHGADSLAEDESAKLKRMDELTKSEQPDSLSVAERAAELASLVDEMLATLQDDEVDSSTESQAQPMRMFDQGHSSMRIPLNPDLAVDSGTTNDSSTERNENSGLHQRVDQGSKMESNTSEPLTLEDVAKHEDALRYLLHHLKEIKNRV